MAVPNRDHRSSGHSSRVHLQMVFLAMVVAVLLYLDRICLSTAAENIQRDLSIDDQQWERVLSAFFLAYALAQVPAGWLGDRFGARWILAAYAILWSASTGLMGFATGASSLIFYRLLCGLFEAGAYPVSAGIVRKWVPVRHRGLASSVVAVGGRLGGALAPILTVQLMLFWTVYYEGSISTPQHASDSSWRPVMIFYGLIGIVVALFFAYLYRDRPESHPRVLPGELDWIRDRLADEPIVASIQKSNESQHAGSSKKGGGSIWQEVISHRGLWLNSFVQFASNFGWAFLVTLFPKYLKEVHGSSLQSQGFLQSLPLFAGIAGLLIGGKLTDYAMRRWGTRWGRATALFLSRGIVMLAFLICPFLHDPLLAALCMAFVGFSSDLGNAACWAYSQDVGGRYAGTVLGWMNMWGNMGAFASPLIFGYWIRSYGAGSEQGWLLAFFFCAAVQLVAAICAFFVDAGCKLNASVEEEETNQGGGTPR